MEHNCVRASRQLLRGTPLLRGQLRSQSRLLSCTARRKADDGSSSRPRHVDLSSVDKSSSPTAAEEAAYRKAVAKVGQDRHHKQMAPKISYTSLPASKVRAYDPKDPRPNRASPSRSPPGQVLRRSRPSPATSRRNEAPSAQPWWSTSQGKGNNPNRRHGPRRSPKDDGGELEERDDADVQIDPKKAYAFDEHMDKVVADDGLARESIPYHPKQPEPTDLEKSWPNTPMSATGSIASISQSLGPLANRQARTHWTPLQLAEMYLKGELVSFHSEDEKVETMRFAKQLRDERAAATGKPALPVPEYSSLVSDNQRRAAERDSLVSNMVQGQYPTLEKQQMPFMNSIVQHLRNNETYSPTDSAKFMARIHKMVDEVQKGGQSQQKRARSQ